MAQSSMEQKEKEIRAGWKDASIVEVYSSSSSKWYKGEIKRIFTDEEGEWLEVLYDAGNDIRHKQVSREDTDTIRPLIPHPRAQKSEIIPNDENINRNISNVPKTEAPVPTPTKKRSRSKTLPSLLHIGKKDTQTKSRKDIKLAPSPRSSNWTEVRFTEDHYAKPCLIDSHQMLIACGDMNPNVYKYDFIKNKLKVFFKYPDKLAPFQVSTCVDYNKQKVYLYCNYPSSKENVFMEYDMNKKSLITYNKNLKDVGAFPVLICLSGNIHLIGGRLNGLHLIWDDMDKMFSERAFMTKSKMIHGHSVIPLEGSKQLLVMGGNDSHLWGGYLGGIWICDTQPSIKWKYLNKIAMPHKMMAFGAIKTKNERHIIIFGGKTKTGVKDEIWILNLVTYEWTKSDIKCPKKGKFYAVKSRDGWIHLFEIDTKHYWKLKLTAIMGNTITKHTRSNSLSDAPVANIHKRKQFTFTTNSVNDEKNNKNDDEKQKNNVDAVSPTKIDWGHKVIEFHNENMKLKKQLKQSKERIDALIQQNVKLNKDMRKMDAAHFKEVQSLKTEISKLKNSNQ